ncbi:site-2 protease family protein [bacterium]|jgi:regulator of sigma E protease|nr:site-2 protease family protein [bacterium]MBT5015183.1 site-2 protease family protein [bacterium]
MAGTALIQSAFFLVVGIFGIGFVIGFHEFGHFLFAKLFNIKAPSFSIGMGPSIITKKIGDTTFQLSALPLGGYVEIIDSHDPDEKDPEMIAKMNIPGKYFSDTPYWQKLIVMLGGIFFNFILGFVFFSFLFLVGMPKSPMINPKYTQPNVIAEFMPGSAGFKAGLQKADKIVAGNSETKLNTMNDVIKFLRAHTDQTVKLTVERNGEEKVISVPLNQKGQIGAMFIMESLPPQGLFQSIRRGWDEMWKCFAQVASSFKSILSRKSQGEIAGPIMIIAQMIMGARMGYKMFLILLAFISINLAFLNMIPVPITDGGQILFNTIEAIIRRPLPEKVRIAIHYVSWFSVLGLFVVLSLKDIMSLVGIQFSSIMAFFR